MKEGLKCRGWNLYSFYLLEIIQVLDSIAWVRCASGNVLSCDQAAIFSGGSELNWRQVGDLPTASTEHRASVVDGTLYVTGGTTNGNNPPSFCSRH